MLNYDEENTELQKKMEKLEKEVKEHVETKL